MPMYFLDENMNTVLSEVIIYSLIYSVNKKSGVAVAKKIPNNRSRS
jgi:hypothetical protein